MMETRINVVLINLFIFTNLLTFIILLLLFNILYIEEIPKLLIIKDLTLIILCLYVLLLIIYKGKIKINSIYKPIFFTSFIFILILSMYLFASPSIELSQLVYFRKFFIFPLMLIIGGILRITDKELFSIIRTLKYILTIVILFGMIEYILPIEFWRNLNINYFNSLIGTDPWANVDIEQSGRFYSWDLYLFFSIILRRMVSIFADPTILANFLILTIPLLLYKPIKHRKDKVLLIFSIVCGFLTISKAFILSILIMFFFKIFKYNKFLFLALNLILFSFVFIIPDGITHGATAHFYGFKEGINLLFSGTIFGLGIGKAGNYSVFGGIESIGGESGFGAMIAQIGIFSLIFIFIVYLAIEKLAILYERTFFWPYKALYVSMICWYIVFLFSESSISITASTIIWMLVGILLNNNKNLNGGKLT